MLEFRGLSAGYYQDLLVLRDVDLLAREGLITAVLGSNGVGKSTLLKVGYGFLAPTDGDVVLDGRVITGAEPQQMLGLGVGYIAQQPGVFDLMSVEENLLLGAWTFRRDRRRMRAALERNYERFPVLLEKAGQRCRELSGGQRRMVEIGRVLMSDPKVLLIDEPSAGLSAHLAAEVYGWLAALRDEGKTILLVDQDIRRALRVADHVYVLEMGRNKLDGPPTDFADLEAAFWR